MRRVCLITGAGGRLGNALCEVLSSNFLIAATYNNTPPRSTSQLQHSIPAPGVEISPVTCDKRIYAIQANLKNRADIRRLVEVALARFGQIDVVINSAADTKFYGNLLDMWYEDPYPLDQIHLNSVAPIELISAIFHAAWKDQSVQNAHQNRCVINVSSISGLYAIGNTGQAIYSASKSALNILTMHLASELAPYSVRVNAICPGRFSDEHATAKVVASVMAFVEGNETGTVR